MLKILLKYANAVYNSYRYDITCELPNEDFLKAKFFKDKQQTEYICSLLYKKVQ